MSARKSFYFCEDLPNVPEILDLGCGTGSQTLQLAEPTQGLTVAVDNHAPSIEKLKQKLAQLSLTDPVRA